MHFLTIYLGQRKPMNLHHALTEGHQALL